MSFPYHRGHTNTGNNNTMSRNRQWGTKEQRVEETNRTLLEQENDARLAELGEQVHLLSEMTRDINKEVKSQNKLLDTMGDSFGSASDLFKNTIGKLGVMIQAGGPNHMCYLVGFIVFVFLFLYFAMGRK